MAGHRRYRNSRVWLATIALLVGAVVGIVPAKLQRVANAIPAALAVDAAGGYQAASDDCGAPRPAPLNVDRSVGGLDESGGSVDFEDACLLPTSAHGPREFAFPHKPRAAVVAVAPLRTGGSGSRAPPSLT